MEPISALSLAASVIQIVECGLSVVKVVYEVKESASGATVENERIEKHTKRLRDLTQNIAQARTTSKQGLASNDETSGRKPLVIETESVPQHTSDLLESLALESESKAGELILQLDKMKIKREKNFLGNAASLTRLFRHKDRIKILQRGLEDLRQQIETCMISDLRELCKRSLSGQVTGFEKIRKDQRAVVAAIAEQQDRIENIISISTAIVNERIEENANLALNKLEKLQFQIHNLELSQKQRDFIDSFKFDGMFARQESISTAARNTYQWVLDESYQGPWDNFPEWLRSDRPVYWVSGKPGSGKSTLMNYIWTERKEDLEKNLLHWSTDHTLVVASVFFWANGSSEMQKSANGFLRALIHQILKAYPTLLWKVTPSLIRSTSTTAYPWHEASLLRLMHSILADDTVKICLFIDGLDEFGESNHHCNTQIISLMTQLIDQADGRLKCCSSSRPEKAFVDHFGRGEKLIMQELTKSDIKKYVEQELQDKVNASLIDTVVEKAQGLFLWVKLAVKDLLHGIALGDKPDKLRKLLDGLPLELDALYSHKIERIRDCDSEEAATYFSLVSQMDNFSHGTLWLLPLTVCEILLSMDRQYYSNLWLPWTSHRLNCLIHDCEQLEERIKYRTAGLLEIQVKETNDNTAQATSHHQNETSWRNRLYSRRVDFIHRTALEFLNKSGWSYVHCSAEKPTLHFLKSWIILMTLEKPFKFLSSSPLIHHSGQSMALKATDRFRFLERITKQPQTRLLKTFAKIAKSSFGRGWIRLCQPDTRCDTCSGRHVSWGLNLLETMAEGYLELSVIDILEKTEFASQKSRKVVVTNLLRSVASRGLIERNALDKSDFIETKLVDYLLAQNGDPSQACPRRLSKGTMSAWEGFMGCLINSCVNYDIWKVGQWRRDAIDNLFEVVNSCLRYAVPLDEPQTHQAFFHGFPASTQLNCTYLLDVTPRFILQSLNIVNYDTPAYAKIEEVAIHVEDQDSWCYYSPADEESADLLRALTEMWQSRLRSRASTPSRRTVRELSYRFLDIHHTHSPQDKPAEDQLPSRLGFGSDRSLLYWPLQKTFSDFELEEDEYSDDDSPSTLVLVRHTSPKSNPRKCVIGTPWPRLRPNRKPDRSS